MQVIATNTGGPTGEDIEKALKRAGFTDTQDLTWRSPGNWKITKRT